MAALTSSAMWAQTIWQPDTSAIGGGAGFEMRYVDQPDDYAGKVRSTIIRLRPEAPTDWGVLYVHGFNDYFFQGEMARKFVDHGYSFYAVDLRKYGRSLMKGQKFTQVRSLDEYFPDIDSALVEMRRGGLRHIVLCGHSTGGLICTYFMKMKEKLGQKTDIADIDALILNSPFLDWNLGWKECLVPTLSALGRLFPDLKVEQSGDGYGRSLLKGRDGEWSYNVEWKRLNSTDVDLGWIRAIHRAQQFVRKKEWPIDKPVLLMYSAESADGEWSEAYKRSDTVLDVDDISRYGRGLGPEVTSVVVKGGLHDLVLSAPGVRSALYRYIFNWLAKIRERPGK